FARCVGGYPPRVFSSSPSRLLQGQKSEEWSLYPGLLEIVFLRPFRLTAPIAVLIIVLKSWIPGRFLANVCRLLAALQALPYPRAALRTTVFGGVGGSPGTIHAHARRRRDGNASQPATGAAVAVRRWRRLGGHESGGF